MLGAAQVEARHQQSLSNGGHINLRINSGKDLVVRDSGLFSKGTSDPFIKIKSGGSRIVGQTNVISKTLCPVWDESFNFDIAPKESPLILLEIFDKDKMSNDDPMGIVSIPLSVILSDDHNSIEKDFPVDKCKGAQEKKLGTINLFISFDPIVPKPIKSGDVSDLSQNFLSIGLGWDVEPTKKRVGAKGTSKPQKIIDLDASAVVFDKRGRMMEAIYFDKLVSTDLCGNGAIVHLGDSKTGDDVFGGDDEIIKLDLSKLKPEVLAIFICVCAFSDGTSFADLVNASCRVYDNNDINMFECHLGKLGPRTAVTMVRIFRDPVGGGWKMGSLFAMDSMARSWGFLIPQFKNNLGTDLVPGLVGHNRDRIAILSKGQSFKIADTCDTIPDVFCVGLHWDVTNGKNIDLDASILLLDDEMHLRDYVAFDKLLTKNFAIKHCGDEREGDEVGDDEKIIIDFDKLGQHSSYLCVLINSYSGEELDDVTDAGCHIFDLNSGRDICKINLAGEKSMDGKTCCFVACFFKVNNSWWIKSTNEGMMGRACRQSYQTVYTYLQEQDLIANKVKELTMQHSALEQFSQQSSSSGDLMGAAVTGGVVGVAVAGGMAVGGGTLAAAGATAVGVGAGAVVGAGTVGATVVAVAGTVAGATVAGSTAVGSVAIGGLTSGINSAQSMEFSQPNVSVPNINVGLQPNLSIPNIGVPDSVSSLATSLGNVNLSLDADVALAGIANLASLSSNIPIVSVLSPLMSGIVDAAREARYNKLAAKLLSDRVTEVALILHDLLKAVSEPSASLNAELQRLEPLLVKCKDFMAKYSKRGYLSKMLCGYSDRENLTILDKGLSDTIQSVTVSLGVMNISMMNNQYQKLDQLADLVRTTGTSTQSGQPLGESSDVVQTIAKCVGVEAREVVSEIQNSLDEIMKSQTEMNGKLDRALGLLDNATTAINTMSGAGSTSKPAPEDPKAFWDDYFGLEKSVPIELFIPVFEDEFCPEVEELCEEERAGLISVLDAYPHDGLVSIVEWKRFCKQCTRAEMGMYQFVQFLTTSNPTEPF